MATEHTIAMALPATSDGRADVTARTEVELVCGYKPGHPGCFYRRNGDPGDPPEPDEAWVVAVWFDGAKLADDHPLTRLVMAWMEADDGFYETVCGMVGAKQAVEAEAMYAAWVDPACRD